MLIIFDKVLYRIIENLYIRFYKNKKDYEKAFEYARRLFDFNGPEREEANTILYEINILNNKWYKNNNIFFVLIIILILKYKELNNLL